LSAKKVGNEGDGSFMGTNGGMKDKKLAVKWCYSFSREKGWGRNSRRRGGAEITVKSRKKRRGSGDEGRKGKIVKIKMGRT